MYIFILPNFERYSWYEFFPETITRAICNAYNNKFYERLKIRNRNHWRTFRKWLKLDLILLTFPRYTWKTWKIKHFIPMLDFNEKCPLRRDETNTINSNLGKLIIMIVYTNYLFMMIARRWILYSEAYLCMKSTSSEKNACEIQNDAR